MVAIDIDGTLINNDMKLTLPTRQAIARARQQGIKVSLATGRCFHSAKNYADRLNLDIPLICANGALIRHRDGTVFLESNFDNSTVAPLLQEMLAAGLCVQVYHKDGIFTSGKTISLRTWIKIICDNKLKLNNLAYTIKEYYMSNVKKIPDLVNKLERDELQIHKIFVAGRHDALEKYPAKAAGLGLSVDYYPGTRDYMYLEIAPPGISKGWALQKLAGHLQIDMVEVAAIGDNLNDTSMIQAAGLGVVMGNGHKQLKAVAGKVTLGNDEDGVAAAINSIILDAYPSRRVV